MKDVLLLSDLEQIKCISQSYRIRILEMFKNEKATAKMISDLMGEPHAKINYHIKEMTKYGILELVEEVAKMSLVEKYYKPVARHFIVDSKSMKFGDEETKASINQYRISLFESLAESFYSSVNKGGSSLKINLTDDLYLTDEQLEALNREIGQVVAKYSAESTERGDVKRYTYGGVIINSSER